jgi:hypothetical protein
LRLEPLYRIPYTYPETWMVALEGGWEQHLLLAEGRCEGLISGRFRGANFPLRRTAVGPFRPDFRAVRARDDPIRDSPDVVIDIAELVWDQSPNDHAPGTGVQFLTWLRSSCRALSHDRRGGMRPLRDMPGPIVVRV